MVLEMMTIKSLAKHSNTAGYRIFDNARGLKKVSMSAFEKFERREGPYPYPMTGMARVIIVHIPYDLSDEPIFQGRHIPLKANNFIDGAAQVKEISRMSLEHQDDLMSEMAEDFLSRLDPNYSPVNRLDEQKRIQENHNPFGMFGCRRVAYNSSGVWSQI